VRRLVSAFVLLNCGLLADTTWQGTTSTSMDTSTNWNPQVVPLPGENLIFPATGVPSLSVLNNIASPPFQIGNLTISNAYAFTGGSFSLGANQSLTYTAAGSSINVGSVIINGFTWTITSVAGGNTIQSPITGTGSINLIAGTLTLSGSNGYSGATTVATGATLTAGSNAAFGTNSAVSLAGTATLNLNNFSNSIGPLTGPTGSTVSLGNAALVINNTGTNTFSGNITGAGGALTIAGTGNYTLSGNNSYTGLTSINQVAVTTTSTTALGINSSVAITSPYLASPAGSLTLGANLTIGGIAGNVGTTVALGANTLTLSNGGIYPMYGEISGTGNLVLTAGTQTMMGTNSYTGTTTLQGGATLNTLNLGLTSSIIFGSGGGNLEIGSNIISSIPIAVNGPATIGTNTYNMSLSSPISGSNSLAKFGLGTLTLTGPNTNAGSISIEGGTLNLTPTSLGNNTTALIFQTFGGTLQAGAPFPNWTVPITLSTPGTIDTNGNNFVVNAAISGPNNLTKAGIGTLTLNVGNNYSGLTIIENGTLNIPSSFFSATTSQLVFAGGPSGTRIFQAGSTYSAFPKPIVFMRSGTIDTNGFNITSSQMVAGSNTSTFTKIGAGTITLSNANTFAGSIAVNGGSLVAGAAATGANGAFGSSADITVGTAGTLDFQTFANPTGDLVNNGIVQAQAIVSATSFTQSATGTLNLNLTTPSQIATTGPITLDGTLNISGTLPTVETILLMSSGTGSQLIGQFATTNTGVTYDYTENKVILGSGTACNGAWATNGDGNWGDLTSHTNWNPSTCTPGVSTNSNQDSATFGTFGASAITVTLANGTGSTSQSILLHDLNFTSATTSYTIQQYNGAGTITLASATNASKPKVSILAGTHTINAPIILNNDSRFSLNSGSLTFGSATTITSSGAQLIFSEGSNGGAIINQGQITPTSVLIQGNTFTNNSVVSPTQSLEINTALSVVGSSLVTNSSTGTMSPGTTLTIGGAGSTSVTNQGTMSSGGAFTISGTGTTVVNNTGTAQLFAGSGQTLTISSGTINNGATSTIGSNTSNINFTGGTLNSLGTIKAANYTQGASATLGLDVTAPAQVVTTAAINLNGTLVVTGTIPTTEVILMKSTGTGRQLTGQFATTTTPNPSVSVNYDYSENLVILSSAAPGACNGTWATAAAGNWGDATSHTNWNPSTCTPGVTGSTDQDSANFGTVGASAVTVTLANGAGNASQDVVLHDLNFDSTSTSYTINQYMGAGAITLDAAMGATKPKITVRSGNHTIDTAIVLNSEARFSLNSGSLTLGEHASITSSSARWNLSEGSGPGTLINYASITPSSLLIEGNVVNNHALINPTTTLAIEGLGGIQGPATVNNFGQITSGTDFTIGGTGPTIVNNQSVMSSVGSFLIRSGTVSNTLGGRLFAGSGQALTISGGAITNGSSSSIGHLDSDIDFTGGWINNYGLITADMYTQEADASLTLNVVSPTVFGQVTAQSAFLDGSLIVNAAPGFMLTSGQGIDLLTAEDLATKFASVTFLNFANGSNPYIAYLDTGVQLNLAGSAPPHVVTSGATPKVVFTSANQHNQFITRKCFQMRDRISQPEVAPEEVALSDQLLTASNDHMAFWNRLTIKKTEQLNEKTAQPEKVASKPWNAYAGPIADVGKVKAKGDQPGFDFHSIGALAGIDYAFQNVGGIDLGIGVLGDYKHVKGQNLFTTNAVHGSLYSTMSPVAAPALAFDGILGFAYDWNTFHTPTGVNNELTAIGKNRDLIYDILFDVEYTLSQRNIQAMPANLQIVPLAAVQYVHANASAYSETNAGPYDLRVDSQVFKSLSTLLGTRIDYLYTTKNFSLRSELDAGWQREYADHDQSIGFTAFNVGNTQSTGTAYGAGRNSLVLGLDFLATINEKVKVEATCSYKLNDLFYDVFFYLGVGGDF
jgi:fibronectin-binding autotransporter adhesin